MENITTYDFAVSVASKCNVNFGSNDISEDDYAATFVSELNGKFSSINGITLSEDDFSDAFVEKLNQNFELLEASQGGDEPVEGEHKFIFLHASDSHGSQYSINKAKELLADESNEISYLIHTGDMFLNTIASDNIRNAIIDGDKHRLDGKLLFVAGNHDVAQAYSGDPALLRHGVFDENDNLQYAGMDTYMDGSGAVFGSSDGCYWHKRVDNVDGMGNRLWIIGICDFQKKYSSTLTNSSITPYLSKEQGDWLCNILKGMGANDYFIIASHYPPFRKGDGDSTIKDYQRTTHIDKDLFLSDRFPNGTNTWLKGHSVLQAIVDSYLNRQNIQLRKTSESKWYPSQTSTNPYYSGSSSINGEFESLEFLGNTAYNFSGCSPAKFLFFLNGHIHADLAYYLCDFPYMLNLNIDTSHSGDTQNWAYDLSRKESGNKLNGNWVLLNKVTIDFNNETIRIDRIGAQITMITESGLNESRIRNNITFPFERT